jgi:hypothetical protein
MGALWSSIESFASQYCRDGDPALNKWSYHVDRAVFRRLCCAAAM